MQEEISRRALLDGGAAAALDAARAADEAEAEGILRARAARGAALADRAQALVLWPRYRLAVRNFRTFRQVKRPGLLENWYVADLSDELQLFYRALMAGERPKLAIEAPPQHGKSVAVRDFVSWFTGRHPQLKTIYASYSEDLGIAANADLSRTIEMPGYSVMFPQVRVGLPGYAFNTSHIEFAGEGGAASFATSPSRGLSMVWAYSSV
jgi:hypothetical protein